LTVPQATGSESRFAPDEMRAASYNFETYSSFFDHDLADVDIHDAGNLEVAENIDDTLFAISKYAINMSMTKRSL